MPAPTNRLRYLGRVIYSDDQSTVELFGSVKSTRDEMSNRFKTHRAARASFAWGEIPGLVIDLNSIRETRAFDPVKGGTVVELFPVHKDGTVEPLPHYEVHVTDRGGTWVNRLHRGVTR